MDTTTSPPSAPSHPARLTDGDRSLVSLFMDLWRETSTLVHDEIELARVEVSEKIDKAGTALAVIATAAVFLFAGFLMLLLAAVNALAILLPEDMAPWLSPLAVGVVVLFAGLIALSKGRHDLSARNLKPERTVESVKRDGELVKEHVK
jgi:uncharacterized membrane protein YqjE